MTKLFLVILCALQFFRVMDATGGAAAALFALAVVVCTGAVDLGGVLARRLRGAVPPKGGRA